MSRRVVVGKRNNGDYGLFVSPAGVDAFTAANSALTLSITAKVSQLILMGSVSSNATVTLGLSSRPIVLVTSYNDMSGVPGHTWGGGPFRPSPPSSGYSNSSVLINSSGASMTITAPVKTVYAVYSKAF